MDLLVRHIQFLQEIYLIWQFPDFGFSGDFLHRIKMKIEAQVLLKNEERFAWYSIMSVLPHVDSMKIWDMGSSDATLKIVDEISKTNAAKNIENFEIKTFKEDKFGEMIWRQKMLDECVSDWALILDADEIWWQDSIRSLLSVVNKEGNKIESIVVPTVNMVGDMYHFQEEKAGRYNIAGHTGHIALRAFSRNIPGLSTQGGHGIFAWTDNNGMRIENRDPKKIKFINAPYIHTTHLKRSGKDGAVFKRKGKLKYEIGISVPLDYFYPEIFFEDRPEIVPSVWQTPQLDYKIRATFETPLKKVYRRTILQYKKHGY